MTPKIEIAHPPNFEQIKAAFPDAVRSDVIFAYGDTIYNPSGNFLPTAILVHEGEHCHRQVMKSTPELWWDAYIEDFNFRYREELVAHTAEFLAQDMSRDRNRRAHLLMTTARRLIAPLYAYPRDFTLQRAMNDIQARL